MKVAVAILAGGAGSGVGGGKPLRILGNERLIDRAVRLARGWSDTIVIAVREVRQVAPGPAQCIADAEGIEGPLGGLAAALQFAADEGADAILTIPADMPFLPGDLAPRLKATLGDRMVAVAASLGTVHPVCALWRPRALAELPAYLATGKRSLRGFAERLGCAVVEWAADGDPFFNINSGEDLLAAETRLARQKSST